MFPRSFYIKSVGIAIPNSKVYASFVVIQTSARAVKTVRALFFLFYSSSSSPSQSAAEASDGIRQSPRGERDTEPTFGPSGRQERLNC